MTDLSLKERFARLGPVWAIDRVPSGTPAVFVLRLPQPAESAPRVIDAMFTLARRGLTMLKAKRHIEALVEHGVTFVHLPTVGDPQAVVAELTQAGIGTAPVAPPADLDIRGLRYHLGLTREKFALRYGIEIETLRNWETGKRAPDATARSYLRAISNEPDSVGRAYAPTPGF